MMLAIEMKVCVLYTHQVLAILEINALARDFPQLISTSFDLHIRFRLAS